jgi:hypothetical protein
MLDPDAITMLPMNATNIHSVVFARAAILHSLRLLLKGGDRGLLLKEPA